MAVTTQEHALHAEPSDSTPPSTPNRSSIFAQIRAAGHPLTITVMAVLLFAIFSIFADHFISTSNIYEMAKVASYTFVVATGMTFLFISGEIDLSLGANISLCSVVMAILITQDHATPWEGALSAVLVGMLVGSVNGFFTTVIGIQSFVVTLGTMSMVGGVSLVLTDGIPVSYPLSFHPTLFAITNGTWDGVPAPIFWSVGIFVLTAVLLRSTRFGYHVYAVGGNARAARAMGVSVWRTKFGCFVLVGLLCGLVAVLQSAWLQEADPGTADTFTLQTITAIIIGGALLGGGGGSMYGTLMGTIITGMLSSGLILLGLNANWPDLVEGAIIVGVITAELTLRRASSSSARGGRLVLDLLMPSRRQY